MFKKKKHISANYKRSIFIFVYILTFAISCKCIGNSEILDDLLERYRSYGLPFPPGDANLVIYDNGVSNIDSNGRERTDKYIAFLFRQDGYSQNQTLLIGPFVHIPQKGQGEIKLVEPGSIDINDIEYQWYKPVFELNVGLCTALQCKNRGWDNLAEALLKKSLKSSYGHHFSAFYQPENLGPKTALTMAEWAYCGNLLIEPDSNRKLISQQMKSLIKEEPKLDTKYNRIIIDSLEAALAPNKSKPGTIEAMIDELTEMCSLSYGLTGQNDYDPKYLRLAELGFKAVPDLIEHLDDKRLTRSVMKGFNNFAPYHRTVGQVVSDLLQNLSGKELGKDPLGRLQGWPVEKKDALSWWSKASKTGEERYLIENVLPSDKKNEFPNIIMLHIITKRYCESLPGIYKTILDKRPNMQSWTVAKAITESTINKEQKIELFSYAGKNKNLEHRRAAFWELKDIDPNRFTDLLLQTLISLPASPQEPYWKCREASFGSLVKETDNEEVWETLKVVAKKSDVGLRIEFLHNMCSCCNEDKNLEKRLDFLKSFLNDAEIRNIHSNPKLFDGPNAGDNFPLLEVRNYAAFVIAGILKMPEMPKPDWTSEQWASYRLKVAEKLKDTGL